MELFSWTLMKIKFTIVGSEIFKYRLEYLYLLIFQTFFLISIFDANITMLYINIKLKLFQGHSPHT